ncbi:MAG: hypothetical protein H7A46_12935 [Verrucomicrobiales bacterium]|nr:hypothetical protein [Verrucomicrobiales bacterium]
MDALPKRLGFHTGMACLLLQVPDELKQMLILPGGPAFTDSPKGRYGFALAFVVSPDRLCPIAQTAIKHTTPMATLWLAHSRAAVQVAAAFQAKAFDDFLKEHRKRRKSQIRIGRAGAEAEWLAIRLAHF